MELTQSPGILYQYQALKNYMVKSNRSLGSIVRDQPEIVQEILSSSS
jgi:hypothetical protein